jgi:glycosyltransferase involved in cell wall biosynthesis
VISQGYGLAALAASATRIPAALLVCSPIEEYYRCRRIANDPARPYRRREIFALRAIARWNAMRGAEYIVLSDHLRGVVQSHGARRAHVVPVYGVDLDVFKPSAETRDAIRGRLALPAGPLVFFSSRIAPEKDSETLLLAVQRLRDRGRAVSILHRSGGWREFLAHAERFGVRDLVIATDAIPPFSKLAEDYTACDLTVQASRAEGLGFSVLESLACGTPVVAARVGGLCETIVDGETGWSYHAGDADDLARRILDALDSPDEAARRTANGRRLVEEKYERGRVFSQLDAVIRSSMARRRR